MKGLLCVFVLTSAGCATAPQSKIRYGFEIEVDKSLPEARNIRYTYGDELVDQRRPSAIPAGPFMSYISSMRIPESFDVSWETPDGVEHQAKVPVLGRVPGRLKNKTVAFVIMADHVEGFVEVMTPFGPKRERFY